MTRFYLRHPPETRPALVVQTCERASDEVIREFRDLLYDLGCSDGLLFDPLRCLIIHDTFKSLGPESLAVEHDVSTDAILDKIDRRPGYPSHPALERRVARWLDALVAWWDDALPDAPELATPFITDVVPAAIEAVISAEDPVA